MHAYEARRAFLQIISKGEGLASPAEAALQIAAEDDALGAPRLGVAQRHRDAKAVPG
jgi:hypothetical protein